MSSLFRSLNSFSNKREVAVKECIINSLSENAKEIQYEFKENGSDYLEMSEATSSLCTTLEALFLHGLKDSFLWQTISVISNDVDHRPEPSFWPPLMVFLHKQVIEQIHSLTQVSREIGYCRAWVRLSVNDSLLSSYLNNIRKNSGALNPYYKKYAMLKDLEMLEMAAKILEGIESCVQINLPLNSSLLNQWPNYSLQLAGIWAPPLKSCPITSGVDVASSIIEVVTIPIPTPKPLSTNELFSESISNSPFRQQSNFQHQDLNHQENLQIFLKKIEEMENIPEEAESGPSDSLNREENAEDEGDKQEAKQDEQPKVGNSLSSLMNGSWSSADPPEDAFSSGSTTLARSNSMNSSISSIHGPVSRYSYNTLLKKHENIRVLDWLDVWEQFEATLGRNGEQSAPTAGTSTSGDPFDFEVVNSPQEGNFTMGELQDMVEKLCKIAHEVGLDAQGFVCKSCSHPLGMDFAVAQVCAFTGNYFCNSCMNVELLLIPARVIYNWDFRKYSVSKKAALFMQDFQYQPFIDLKVLNPDIYQAIDEMAVLQSLRIKLNFIRAYLYTCCTSSIQELEKHVYSKEYLYEHIHQYSIADLCTIPKGVLASQLQRAVHFGEQHVLKCSLCSLKGFICEICNSPKVLYPFHIETTYRCSICGAVFHANCLSDSEPCPKCERRRKREDLPLLEAVPLL